MGTTASGRATRDNDSIVACLGRSPPFALATSGCLGRPISWAGRLSVTPPTTGRRTRWPAGAGNGSDIFRASSSGRSDLSQLRCLPGQAQRPRVPNRPIWSHVDRLTSRASSMETRMDEQLCKMWLADPAVGRPAYDALLDDVERSVPIRSFARTIGPGSLWVRRWSNWPSPTALISRLRLYASAVMGAPSPPLPTHNPKASRSRSR
jgi:hypothetical protein